MIEVQDLRKFYGDFEAVRGVSFSAEAGFIVGLLGPNGAGKTTIMKVLTGYHGPTSGSVRIAGFDVAEDPLEVKRSVGYLPETVPLYTDLTVEEYLSFMADARGLTGVRRVEALEASCRTCGIEEFLPVPIEHLSKGYRQRVGLAQAILGDPPILVLDEPTTGLDPNQILEIRSLIRALGLRKTVILSTHILQEAEALCSSVLILNEGVIVGRGSPEEIAESLKEEEGLELVLKGANAASIQEAAARLRLGRLVGSPELQASGAVRILLKAPPGRADDAAEGVSDWARAEGFTILEMRRQRLSLEEVFVRLTREDAQ